MRRDGPELPALRLCLQRNRPTQLQVTFRPYELATLVSAARWVVEGVGGELTPEAVDQLEQVLSNYDRACREADQPAT